MEIQDLREFLNYFGKVHERTMKVVRCIPPEKVDWRFRDDKFTIGDLVRHIATANRYIFMEVIQGKPSAYAGCGKHLAPTLNDIIAPCAHPREERLKFRVPEEEITHKMGFAATRACSRGWCSTRA